MHLPTSSHSSCHRQSKRIRAHAPAPRPALQGYDRARDLPRLLPVWPNEIAELTAEAHHRLIQRLRRALREERRRGLAGAWTYDLARHAKLYRALQAELAATPLPLSSSAASTFRNERNDRTGGLAITAQPAACPGISLGASPAPFSSRAETGQRRSSARPSGSHAGAAISPDILQVTSCSGSANGA